MLSPVMTVFDRLERRWAWLAFPGFLRYYAVFHLIVFALQWMRPDLGELFEFDRAKIFSGEIWRVMTLFFSVSEFGNPKNPLAVLFLVFAVNFVFMVGDGLESAWGSFKASLFYYTGILLIVVMNFLYPSAIPGSGIALYGAAFLAFATLFPKLEIRLFFVLPIQIRFLGMLEGAILALQVFDRPEMLPFILGAYANYFIWAGIPAWRGTLRVIASSQRKKRFNSSKIDESEAFHTCVVCQRNDVMDPEMEFRIGGDGREYCSEHLPD